MKVIAIFPFFSPECASVGVGSGSLDSLDSVSSSIQQARANSLLNNNCNNGRQQQQQQQQPRHYGSAGRLLGEDNPAYRYV